MRDKETILKWLRYCALESPEHGCVESCPYLQLQDESENAFCGDILMADALALLTPRVLTLREIMGGADIAYVQSRHGLVQPCVIDHKESDKPMCTMALGINVPYDHRWDKYGINWRCWSDKPTEEQEEEPWDD